MTEKVGRNEDCPCGSGKKYKKCCLKVAEVEQVEKLPYQQMLDLEQKIVPKLVQFADKTFGEDALDDAWNVFVDDGDEQPFENEDPINVVFVPWFLYSWNLEGPHERRKPTAPLHETVVEAYLKAKPNLGMEEKRYLQAVNRRPFSLMEVKDVAPGKSITLYDFFLDKTYLVTEKLEQTGLKVGEIVLAAVFWPIQESETLLMSLGPYTIAAEQRPKVLEYRKDILTSNQVQSIDEDLLFEEQLNVFAYYFDLIDDEKEEETLDGADLTLKAEVRDLFQGHWCEWIDLAQAELGGQTPRQAVGTPEGKAIVEKQLIEFAVSTEKRPGNLANPDIVKLRKELGI